MSLQLIEKQKKKRAEKAKVIALINQVLDINEAIKDENSRNARDKDFRKIIQAKDQRHRIFKFLQINQFHNGSSKSKDNQTLYDELSTERYKRSDSDDEYGEIEYDQIWRDQIPDRIEARPLSREAVRKAAKTRKKAQSRDIRAKITQELRKQRQKRKKR